MSALTALVEGRPLTSQERIEALSWHTQLAQAEATIAAVRGELHRDVLATADRLKRAREEQAGAIQASRRGQGRLSRPAPTSEDRRILARLLPALKETT